MKRIIQLTEKDLRSMVKEALFETSNPRRNQDEFSMSENAGRKKALASLSKIRSIFPDGYDDYTIKPASDKSRWDFECYDNDNGELLAIIEAKDRQMPSTDNRILKEGCQMELPKYASLKAYADKKGIPSFYLATFNDNVFYLWNLDRTQVTKDSRMCNRTTAVDTGKVMKDCVYFPINQSVAKGNF